MCVCFSYDVIRYFVIPVIGYVFGYVIPVMRACAGDCVRLRDLCHPRYPRLLCDPRYVLVYVICDPLFLFSVICPRSRFRLSYAGGLCSSGMSRQYAEGVGEPKCTRRDSTGCTPSRTWGRRLGTPSRPKTL